jgi:hypothetical protein
VISVGSFARNILMIGGIAVAAANVAPAHAQALGDADCPGGYYFYPAYGVCVPYGYAYVPDDYPPPIYAPQPYGPTYLFLGEGRDHDRDRRSGQHRRHDDDQHRR